MTSPRRFPPPWQVEQTPGVFKVLAAGGQARVYVYARETPNEANIAGVLTFDEARLIGRNTSPRRQLRNIQSGHRNRGRESVGNTDTKPASTVVAHTWRARSTLVRQAEEDSRKRSAASAHCRQWRQCQNRADQHQPHCRDPHSPTMVTPTLQSVRHKRQPLWCVFSWR
jgi:hypothetical protein